MFLVSVLVNSAAAAQGTDPLEPLKDRDPYTYVIGTVLMLGISACIWALRVLWTDNRGLHKEKDQLHESKLQFAVDATNTMKEAISLVQEVHNKLDPLAQGEQDRKLFQQEISQKLEQMQKTVEDAVEDIKKAVENDK